MQMTTKEDTYVPARPIMTAAELLEHRAHSYGRDYSESDDGYSDMEAEEGRGWTCLSGWGRDGYDLGDWPYVMIYLRRYPDNGAMGVMSICEGDRDVYYFTSASDALAAVDYLFIWYGINRGYDTWEALGVTSLEALDAGTLRVPVELRGPYGRMRSELS